MRSKAWAILAAYAMTSSLGCGDANPEAGAWEFKIDTVRATGGKVHQTSWLRLVGEERAEGGARAKPVILSFDCLPDQASNTIMTEQALRQGSAEVRLTVDSKPPRNLPAFAGTTTTGGQVVLTIPQDSLLALFNGSQRAVIHYSDGAGSSKTTAEFPLAGLDTYRESFRAACAQRRE